MRKQVLRLAACCLVLQAAIPAPLHAQAQPQPVATAADAANAFNTEQLDALLAPIALYPDPLLTQVLMASTFPLQIVTASRWMEDPAHKGLTGDALTKALETENWDPSVKSLVPFPQVVAMLNGNLEWTQQLGYAFADQQAAVMDSVQRLRHQAQTNGSLQTTPQQVVRVEQQAIVIEPAQPEVVYVPSYNPTVVYGTWPYPSYPPVYPTPAPGYAVGTALMSGLAFGAGVAITAGLWNWARPAWGRGNVNVNVNRYNSINVHGARINSNVWQPNRAGGRPAGMARAPGGPVGRPARATGLPANAIGRQRVSVPRSAVNPPARTTGAAQRGRPTTQGARTGAAQPRATQQRTRTTPSVQRPNVSRPANSNQGIPRPWCLQRHQPGPAGTAVQPARRAEPDQPSDATICPERRRRRTCRRTRWAAVRTRAMTMTLRRPVVALAFCLLIVFGCGGAWGATAPAQHSFDSPQAAAAALAQAARSDDKAALQAIFGPGHDKLLFSGDPYADREQLRQFAELYDEKRNLVPKGPGRVVLEVGPDDWPLPIPIVQQDGHWRFDTGAGAEELVNRRIGRNELATIQVMLTYVEAQQDFFARAAKQAGTGYYARRLISRPGRRDGLYWPSEADAAESPFGPLIAQAQSEGYPGEMSHGKPTPYHGYYFRILTAQGPDAPGGAKDYVQSGRMTKGFALLAWPASYGASGIMSFQVNQDGIVFQKDLGPDTARLASEMLRFNPDLSWAEVTVSGQ